ncbi:MAG: GPP34 family phosphoprotein [Dehalococcoidia bacterium]|nr:GPP34 family phosphoprotein [Dehalococcoidia bacterium]
MDLLLADELLLIALGAPGRIPGDVEVRLPYVLAGALLAELVATGRVRCTGDRFAPFDVWPTGRPGFDSILYRLRTSNSVGVERWLWKAASIPRLTARLRGDLVSSGRLGRRRRFAWSPFPRIFVPASEWQLQAVAAGVLDSLDARSVALGQLALVARLVDRVSSAAGGTSARTTLPGSWSDEAFSRSMATAFGSARELEVELAQLFRTTTQLADRADRDAHSP